MTIKPQKLRLLKVLDMLLFSSAVAFSSVAFQDAHHMPSHTNFDAIKMFQYFRHFHVTKL